MADVTSAATSASSMSAWDKAASASQMASGGMDITFGLGSLIWNIINANRMREDQRYYYEDQKQWNSPANQMRLRAQAGLNPYSDFTTTPIQQPGVIDGSSGINSAMSNLSTSINSAANKVFERLSQKIALKQLQLQEKKIDVESKKTEKESELLDKKVSYQEFLNGLESQLAPYRLSQAQYTSDSLYWDSLLKQFNWDTAGDLFSANLEKIFSEIGLNNQQSKSLKSNTTLNWKRFEDIEKEDLQLRKNKDKRDESLFNLESTQREFNQSLIKMIDEVEKSIKPTGKPALDNMIKFGLLGLKAYLANALNNK